ncbi:GapA-binding peptide SR1P [Jeotgalibacillus soli]|uniref:GapA-binding peptide SR1P n=1 Tax=Jeotgalibacillus soli TaxID=889306 RepID=UPI000AC9D2B5|nr:GapA-binding peptide SR1P [Jeotgalibacillus soli]
MTDNIRVAMGTIVCKCCGKQIDSVATKKVVVYYSTCKQQQCIDQVSLLNDNKSKVLSY